MGNIISKFKNLSFKLKPSKSSYEKRSIRPYKDWKIMLSTTFVLTILLALLAFYFYTKVDNGTLFTVDSSKLPSETKVNTALLKNVIDGINTREKNFNEVKGGSAIQADPSI